MIVKLLCGIELEYVSRDVYSYLYMEKGMVINKIFDKAATGRTGFKAHSNSIATGCWKKANIYIPCVEIL